MNCLSTDELTCSDEQACRGLYEKLCEASMEKDALGIASVLAENYHLQHMTGMRQSKQEYIDAVLDGTLNYYDTSHDAIAVEILPGGENALIRGQSRITAAVFGGGRRTWRLQQDLKAQKRDGLWKLVSSKASTY